MGTINNILKNRTIKWKLSFLAWFLIIMMIFMGLVAGIGAFILNRQTKVITKEWLPSMELSGDMNYLTSDYRIKQYAHIASSTMERMQEFESEIAALEDQINAIIDEYGEDITSAEDRKIYEEAIASWEDYKEITGTEFYLLSRNGNLEEANEIMLTDAREAFKTFQDKFDKLVDFNKQGANDASSSAEIVFIMILIALIVLVVFAVFIAFNVAKVLVNGIVEPVKELQVVSKNIAAGNLHLDITYEGQDELGELADNFRETCVQLRTIIKDASDILAQMAVGNFNINTKHESAYVGEFVGLLTGMRKTNRKLDATLKEIKDASYQVNEGSSQLAISAQNLAEGATEQAGAVEELTATIENVGNISETSAENALSAADKAKLSAENASKSREQMNELIQAMNRITDTSNQIANIIEAIEDIASQTNLLSLNASIEAARAGEAGKGFAVVADQIGKLASDSAKSAIDTRELIEKSIVEVKNGNKIVEGTIGVIGQVLSGMEEFAEIVMSMAEDSQVQANMLKQISGGINQISTVVQSNSATSEETSAISEELSAQAISLTEMIGVFKLRD